MRLLKSAFNFSNRRRFGGRVGVVSEDRRMDQTPPSSVPPANNCLPSCKTERSDKTESDAARNDCISCRRVGTSQRRTVSSSLPDANVRRSGENTITLTEAYARQPFQEVSGGDVGPLNVSPIITHDQRLAVRREGRAVDKNKTAIAASVRFPGIGGPEIALPS